MGEIVSCQFCNSAAYRSGPQYFGFGINSQTYICSKCHAFCVFIKHSSKQISQITFDVKYLEEKKDN